MLRALVLGDDQALVVYEARLVEQGWAGAPRFLGTLFRLMVRRRFVMWCEADVVRFVAELRAVHDPSIDPRAAETLIRRVFDPAVVVDVGPVVLGQIQMLVVYELLAGESPYEVDETLREAEELSMA